MARRRSAQKRQVNPDSVYNSRLVTKFINCMMKGGKKSVSEKILYSALKIVTEKTDREFSAGYDLLKKAIENVSPVVEVRSRRVGGATYQIPVEVSAQRQCALAIRWIIDAARKRREKGMITRLAHELLDALSNKGGAYEMMERVMKMAKANQAFAHYRW